MGEPAAIPDQLSARELNLFELLDSAGITMTAPNGKVRWALDADDVCELLALAHELLADWDAKTPRDAYTRAARLLDVPVPAELDGGRRGHAGGRLLRAVGSPGRRPVAWRRWPPAVGAVLGALLAARVRRGRRKPAPTAEH